MKRRVIVGILCLLVSGPVYLSSFAQVNRDRNYAFEDARMARKVEALLAGMSMEEKIAQLHGIRPKLLMENNRLSVEKCRELIPNGIGQLCQFTSSAVWTPEEVKQFVDELQHFLTTETPSGIPAIMHEEGITGFPSLGATTYPQHIGVGCSWNPDLVQKKAEYTAQTMRSVGSTLALSPMLDISRTAYYDRMEEGFGEDSYLTARMGLAFVNGLQTEGLENGVAATVKHFAGYGGGTDDEKEFFEETLMPFEVAIRLGGAKSLMSGYHAYKGIPCSGSEELLTDILRNTFGFDGIVVSDYGSIEKMIRDGYAADELDAGAKGINAGVDAELDKGVTYLLLEEAIAQGRVTQARLDEAVKHILTMKARLGLLDEKESFTSQQPLDFDPPAHREMAYELATQSVVLLKNDGILPLTNEKTKKIALVGPNSDAVQSLLGDYTYQSLSCFFWGIPTNPDSPKLVTLLEGMRNKIGDRFTLQHDRGCNWSPMSEIKIDVNAGDPRMDRVKAMAIKGLPIPDWDNALKIAAESDVVIAAMGENLYLCGEARQRDGIRLPGEQEDFVKALIAVGKPVVLIVFGGRPQVITELEPHCAAILHAWYPGEEGGNAVADLLLGNVDPSAKLCITYPKDEQRIPYSYNEGYDPARPPLYPFGHGLTYTTFGYRDLWTSGQAVTNDEWVEVACTVRNTGSRKGTEIVQLYVTPKGLSVLGKPLQLKGFQRVTLAPGEEKEVYFKLYLEQLAYYDNGRWVIEAGNYDIQVGPSSQDRPLSEPISITGRTRTLSNRNLFFSDTN